MEKKVLEPHGELVQQQHYIQLYPQKHYIQLYPQQHHLQQQHVVIHQQLQQPYGIGPQVRFVRVHRPHMNQYGPQRHHNPQVGQYPLRIIRPGQQIRIVTQRSQGGPQYVLQGPRPNLNQQYNQRPIIPTPPMQNDIVYDMEHVFREGGKEYRKMPVLVDGKTMWVDCPDMDTKDMTNVIPNMDSNNTSNNTNPNKTNSVINNDKQGPPGDNPKRLKTDKQESNVQSGDHLPDVGFESVQKYIDSL